MESWTWPPQYDAAYRPSPSQACWFPVRETMEPDARDRIILERINAIMSYAAERSPFYRQKWRAAGVPIGRLASLADFEHVPVVTKEELRADQAAHEPFGSYVCVSDEEIAHVHGTSGTTGRPTAFGISSTDWTSIANAHARVMWAMGIRPRDVVLVASPLSLYMGSWGAYIGAERLGARVFPFGAGTPGQSARTLQWMRQMKATVFYGTPSYALRLAEVAEAEGFDLSDLTLRAMFFSGEPGASIESIRRRIESTFQARVFDSGSMAEVGAWMHLGADEDTTAGMLCWQDIVYTEVCDPTTLLRVPFGSEGTPVYTTLERVSQPMIRLLSNDLTRWEAPAQDSLRSYPRLPRGVYGRIDDAFTIRGENIYPSAIDEILMSDPLYAGEHRILVSRERSMDRLELQVEYLRGADDPSVGDWLEALGRRFRRALGIGAVVNAVDPNTLDRAEFKARRVIDTRNLLRDAGDRSGSIR